MADALVIWRQQGLDGKPIGGCLVAGASVEHGNWQATANPCGDAFTELSPGSYDMTFSAPGFVTRTYAAGIMNAGVITTALERSKPAWDVDAVRHFNGNFCGIVLPYLTYGPDVPGGKLLFTPGLVCEPPDIRKRAMDDYRKAGFIHCPLNLTNHSPVYHGIYPDWDDLIINDVLKDAFAAGLLPGGAAMGDDDDSVSGHADPFLVPWVFPKWEQNGPDGNDTAKINRHIEATRAAFPDAQCYVHFTAGHAAGGSPEGEWWQWAWSIGVRGILYQHDLGRDTAQQCADRCADFLVRFGDPNNYPGWPKGPDFVLYETTAYPVFWNQMTQEAAHAKNREAWRLISQQPYPAIGFCNG